MQMQIPSGGHERDMKYFFLYFALIFCVHVCRTFFWFVQNFPIIFSSTANKNIRDYNQCIQSKDRLSKFLQQ
jgi:hypothetical protein